MESFSKTIFDACSTEETLDEMFRKENPDALVEIVRTVQSVFTISPNETLERFLVHTCSSDLPITVRVDCAETLYREQMSSDKGLTCLYSLVDQLEPLPVPYQLQQYLYLFKSGKFPDMEERLCLLAKKHATIAKTVKKYLGEGIQVKPLEQSQFEVQQDKTSIVDMLLEKVAINTDNEDKPPTSHNSTLHELIFDFSIDETERIRAVDTLYQENPDEIVEITSKMASAYILSPIGIIRRFLTAICSTTIPLNIRIECAHALCCEEDSRDVGLHSLYSLIHRFDSLPIPCELEQLLFLIESERFPDVIDFLLDFVNRDTIDIVYRYKTIITTIQQRLGNEIMIKALRLFMSANHNDIRYKILACQNLVQDVSQQPIVEEWLIDVMNNEEFDNRIRADAADVLVRFGSPYLVQDALELLQRLGGGSHIRSIYENSENVHVKEIDKSVMEILCYLESIQPTELPEFDTIVRFLMELARKTYHTKDEEISKEETAIQVALTRIELDTTSFTASSHTLRHALRLLFSYIYDHDILLLRLMEELIEMSETCSSGYITRLMNVLSGFGNHSLKISWSDQIIANLIGRMNSRLRTDTNRDTVLEEMTNANITNKFQFLEFIRRNILSVREELYEEFKDYVSDDEFDLYFKEAIINYEK